jgi:hypothetical protein
MAQRIIPRARELIAFAGIQSQRSCSHYGGGSILCVKLRLDRWSIGLTDRRAEGGGKVKPHLLNCRYVRFNILIKCSTINHLPSFCVAFGTTVWPVVARHELIPRSELPLSYVLTNSTPLLFFPFNLHCARYRSRSHP